MSMARTIEERVAMVRLFSKYENAHEVRRQWKHHFNTSSLASATITVVDQRFNKTGNVEDLPHTGRPVTALTEKRIQDMVNTNPRLLIRQGSIQVGISRSRYHVAMQKLQLKPYHPTLIVNLNKDDFGRHSQLSEICLEKFNYDPDLVDHSLWSDECKFDRNGIVNRHNCTYWSTENPHAKFSVLNTEEGMMWFIIKWTPWPLLFR